MPVTEAPKLPPPPSGWANVVSMVPEEMEVNGINGPDGLKRKPAPPLPSTGEPIKMFGPTDATDVPNPIVPGAG